MTQEALGKATGVSTSYVNQTMTGRKLASARWVNLVVETLRAQEAERRRLNVAAARDNGYEVD